MVSTFTANISLEKPGNGDDVNIWDVPVNADWDVLDLVLGGSVTINAVGASGTVVLTLAQYRPRIITVSGLLTANVNYQFPTGVGGQWSVFNNTTGAFTVTFSSGGAGSSVTLLQGFRTSLLCDGTNVSLVLPAGGSTGQLQYNAAGFFVGSANLTFDGSTLTLNGALATPLGTGINSSGQYAVNSISNTAVNFLDPAGSVSAFENSTGTASQDCYSGSTSTVAARSVRLQSTAPMYDAYVYQGSTVGSVVPNGSNGVSYLTASDEELKEFEGLYDPLEAIRIIKADPVRMYKWKDSGESAIGWGAQTSYRISPDLATPGSEERDLSGKRLRPWGVDKGDRTTRLWPAVGWLIDQVDALKSENEKLRTAIGQ